ncbi:MAG: tetratricopeptide (TPR) repeat protein, partial [Oceanospirillaceae bacterium]
MRILTVFLFLMNYAAVAQEEINADSLKNIFSTTSKLRVRTSAAVQISKHYNRVNIDSNAKYLAISKRLVAELKDDKLTARHYLNQGNYFNNTGQPIKGIKEYEQAISLYENLKDTLGLANTYNSLGVIYKFQG